MGTTKSLLLTVFVLITCCSYALAQAYDPELFTVCPERSCYVLCPSGDISFCFCISYDGQPLLAPPEEVYLSIECPGELLLLHDSSVKASYLVTEECHSVQGCGREYCWAFQASGCCENATISLHMIGDPTPFYQIEVPIHTLDLDYDCYVTTSDSMIVVENYGSPYHCYDMNCDGVVNSLDTYPWIPMLCAPLCPTHLGHNCSHIIGTKASTWGAIKQIYK
ncbi:MAG: hypothetical protein JSV33_13050 [bacterium]|nr:MAG: hypothetical protein JSV33_13050 [bacterium]